MSLQEKLNAYQEILTVLCETAEDIHHAVLITAHKVDGINPNTYDTTISEFHCDPDRTRRILKDALEKLTLSQGEYPPGTKLQ